MAIDDYTHYFFAQGNGENRESQSPSPERSSPSPERCSPVSPVNSRTQISPQRRSRRSEHRSEGSFLGFNLNGVQQQLGENLSELKEGISDLNLSFQPQPRVNSEFLEPRLIEGSHENSQALVSANTQSVAVQQSQNPQQISSQKQVSQENSVGRRIRKRLMLPGESEDQVPDVYVSESEPAEPAPEPEKFNLNSSASENDNNEKIYSASSENRLNSSSSENRRPKDKKSRKKKKDEKKVGLDDIAQFATKMVEADVRFVQVNDLWHKNKEKLRKQFSGSSSSESERQHQDGERLNQYNSQQVNSQVQDPRRQQDINDKYYISNSESENETNVKNGSNFVQCNELKQENLKKLENRTKPKSKIQIMQGVNATTIKEKYPLPQSSSAGLSKNQFNIAQFDQQAKSQAKGASKINNDSKTQYSKTQFSASDNERKFLVADSSAFESDSSMDESNLGKSWSKTNTACSGFDSDQDRQQYISIVRSAQAAAAAAIRKEEMKKLGKGQGLPLKNREQYLSSSSSDESFTENSAAENSDQVVDLMGSSSSAEERGQPGASGSSSSAQQFQSSSAEENLVCTEAKDQQVMSKKDKEKAELDKTFYTVSYYCDKCSKKFTVRRPKMLDNITEQMKKHEQRFDTSKNSSKPKSQASIIRQQRQYLEYLRQNVKNVLKDFRHRASEHQLQTNHFVEVLSKQPLPGDYIYTTKMRVELGNKNDIVGNGGILGPFLPGLVTPYNHKVRGGDGVDEKKKKKKSDKNDKTSYSEEELMENEVSNSKTKNSKRKDRDNVELDGGKQVKSFLPSIQERHAVYFPPGEDTTGVTDFDDKIDAGEVSHGTVVTFQYIDNQSWAQDQAKTQVEMLSLEEFRGIDKRKIYLRRGAEIDSRAFKSLIDSYMQQLSNKVYQQQQQQQFQNMSLFQLQLHYRLNQSLILPQRRILLQAKAFLKKRGFNLHQWNCSHMSSLVSLQLDEQKFKEEHSLSFGHWGNFIVNDPLFPFGYLSCVVKNHYEKKDHDEDLIAQQQEQEGLWTRCRHRTFNTTTGSSYNGSSPKNHKNMRFKCDNGHKFCRWCVKQHLEERGISQQEWRALFPKKCVCPHSCCYAILDFETDQDKDSKKKRR